MNDDTNSFLSFRIKVVTLFLAFVLFVLVLLFSISKVDAETIDVDKYRIESINANFGIGQYVYYGNTMSVNNNYIVYGFQWLPVTGTSSSQTNIPINAGSYSIDVSFYLTTEDAFTINKLDNTLPWFYMFVNRNVAASCDGTETFYRINKYPHTGGGYDYLYRYHCSQLDVTQNFNNIMFRVIIPGLDQLEYPQAIKSFGIFFSRATDLNDLSSDTNAIISANDQNTNSIINNNNNNTTIINDSIEDIGDIINDDSVSSDTGSSFFSNFNTTDHGGLSSIVTAPVRLVGALVEGGSCTPLTGTYRNQQFSLPCGDIIWSRSGVTPLKEFLNLTFGGLLIYYCLRKLYLKIHDLKDPEDDRIEVMKL